MKVRQCDEKHRYESRKHAAYAAAQQRARLGQPIMAYHCRWHHCWHTGHPPGWKDEHPDDYANSTFAPRSEHTPEQLKRFGRPKEWRRRQREEQRGPDDDE